MAAYNPRYAAFARANGRTADEQIAIDRARHVGRMMPFITWSGEQIAKFAKANPAAFMRGTLIDHDAYDRWLGQESARQESEKGQDSAGRAALNAEPSR